MKYMWNIDVILPLKEILAEFCAWRQRFFDNTVPNDSSNLDVLVKKGRLPFCLCLVFLLWFWC